LSNIKSVKKKVFKQIDERKEELVRLGSKIISMPTENPPGDTTELGKFLKDYIESKGLSANIYEPKKSMVNVVSSLKRENAQPHLILNHHMDHFPAGERSSWSFPPYCGDVVDGKIRGKGATDMKGGLTASLFAYTILGNFDEEMTGNLTIMFVPDEESAGPWGTRWLLDNVPEVRGSAVLNGEPSGIDNLAIGQKACFFIRLRTLGAAFHGSTSAWTMKDNAIAKMSSLIPIIQMLTRLTGEAPQELREVMATQKEWFRSSDQQGGADSLERVTINFGKIKGGTSALPNVVPEMCELDVDIRVPIGLTSRDVARVLQSEIAKVDRNVEYEVTQEIDPNWTSPNEKIVKLTVANVEEVTGKKPQLEISLWGSELPYFRVRGIPGVCYGPSPVPMGMSNEYVKIDELVTVAKVHAGTALDYVMGN
jgi:succinyl-diaminopimelate desuccinylase